MTEARFISDIAFTSAVKAAQEARGSRRNYQRMAEKRDWAVEITDDLAAFVAARDSFYLGTASAAGRPYIQHRGGRPGFLKVLGPRILGFADFSGNRQYISVGNLAENDRAFLLLMDHAARRRVKVWGRAWVVEDDPDLLIRLSDPDYPGRPERAIIFEAEAWDVNCPQHIVPRYTEDQVGSIVADLRARIAELEGEVARLRDGGC